MQQRKNTRASELLRSAAAALTLSATTNIWENLVCCLGQALNVDWVIVGKLLPGEQKVTTLAAWQQGKIVQNFEYQADRDTDVDLQPENVRLYFKGSGKPFPNPWLQRVQAEAFGEITLVDSLGLAQGTLAFAHSHPIEEADHIQSMLRIFAFKAAVELERQLADEHFYADFLGTLRSRQPESDRLVR